MAGKEDVTEVNGRRGKVELQWKRNTEKKRALLSLKHSNDPLLFTKLYDRTLNSPSTGMCFSVKSGEERKCKVKPLISPLRL